jgi:membrane-bound serine protease (ClpP class)
LFVLEVKITSYGLLTLGGTVSLTVGALMLIDGPIPELRVSPLVILPTSLAIAATIAFAMRLTLRAQRAGVTTGVEGLVAEIGTVTRALDPTGKVFIRGELWDAFSHGEAIPEGTRVRVRRIDDLRLEVTPANDVNPPANPHDP